MSLKITPQEIENKIDKADYHRVGETTAIVCSLTLKSGFVVIGKAACLSHDILMNRWAVNWHTKMLFAICGNWKLIV